MKKLLSIVLTAAMLLSILIVATVSVTAVQGEWSAYAKKGAYEALYNLQFR